MASALRKGLGLSSKSAGKDGGDEAAAPDAETSERWESGSVASSASKASKTSFLSSKAASATAALKKGFSRPFRSGKPQTISMADLQVGDRLETISKATMREGWRKESSLVEELAPGTLCEILEIGGDVRIRVKVLDTDVEGWISAMTPLNEPLIVKKEEDFDLVVGEHYEVKCLTTVQVTEDIDSEVKAKLKPGTRVQFLETGKFTNFRAKVNANMVTGWMTVANAQGEKLLAKASSTAKGREGVMFEPKFMKIKTLLETALAGELAGLKRVVEGGTLTKLAGRASSSRAHLNSPDARGKTALMYTCALGHKACVEYLLARTDEVDVNSVDDTQKSALHHASKRGGARRAGESPTVQDEIVTMLLAAGAQIEARDHNGCTALMFSVANGDEYVSRRLLGAGANINVKDFEGHTPLDYAINFNKTRIIAVLKAAGAVGTLDQEETAGPDSESAQEPPSPEDEAAKKDKKKKSDKAEDGAGKKRKKWKRQQAATMMEALGGDDPQEVNVEAADEDASELDKAIAKLNALVESSSATMFELEAAIKSAHSLGAEDKDLQEAAKRIKDLRATQKAQERLSEAIESLDVAKLRKAIVKAQEAKVPKAEIKEAKRVLAEEEPKAQVREQLRLAEDAGDAAALKAALQEAKAVGLDSEEMAEFEKLLAGAESKEKAEAALKAAIEERNIHALKFAIQQAKEAGVEREQVRAARAVLKEEEPKQAARELLEKAIEKCSIPALQEAIAAAEAAPLEASEYKAAKRLLKQEEEKERQLGAVKQALLDVKSVDTTSIDALRAAKEKLSEAIKAAIKSGVAESAVADAEQRRKKLHNAIEDLKGSIRVFCRVRPLSGTEKDRGDTTITSPVDSMTLKVEQESGAQQFIFDAVYTPGSQEEIFEDCRDLVQSAVDGYNVTMFAYGQTGAGKTFTMYGVPGQQGTAPRTIGEIYRVIEQGKSRFTYTVMASMLELYKNDLVDLLSKGNPTASKSKLNVRQDKSGTVVVEHLTEEECRTPEELSALLERGNQQRTVAATAMNSESSRSHLVLMIKVISINRETKEQLRGKILIVDLAGSERLKKSQVSEDMQKEAIEINKSLTALGDVIEALTKGNKMVPYRNHKLTQLMQDSIGGSAKTLMFVNCSPANTNTDETVMSLKYATRAKTITNTAKKNS